MNRLITPSINFCFCFLVFWFFLFYIKGINLHGYLILRPEKKMRVVEHMRLLGQFQTSFFFFRKLFARTKTQIKPKPTNFLSLRSFSARKLLPLLFFVPLILFCCLVLVWFAVLQVRNLFVKKIKLVWNCPNNLINSTIDVYPY